MEKRNPFRFEGKQWIVDRWQFVDGSGQLSSAELMWRRRPRRRRRRHGKEAESFPLYSG